MNLLLTFLPVTLVVAQHIFAALNDRPPCGEGLDM